MARAHKVASSRTPHNCWAGHVIEPPEGYTWAAPGFRARKKFACAKHPFRPSQLTTGLVSEALSAAEAFEDALDAIDTSADDALDDVTAAVEEFSSAIEDYASQRREAADAWENGNSQLEEYADIAEAALDEIQSFDVADYDGDTAEEDDDSEDADELRGAYAAHVEEQIDAARELAVLEF